MKKIFTLISGMMLSAGFLVAAKTQTVAAASVEPTTNETKIKHVPAKTVQVPDEAVNPLLRSMAHTANTEYFPKKKVTWHVIDSTTGANGVLMQSNTGKYKYVVTRSPTEAVLHVMQQGWGNAMGNGFGFPH